MVARVMGSLKVPHCGAIFKPLFSLASKISVNQILTIYARKHFGVSAFGSLSGSARAMPVKTLLRGLRQRPAVSGGRVGSILHSEADHLPFGIRPPMAQILRLQDRAAGTEPAPAVASA